MSVLTRLNAVLLLVVPTLLAAAAPSAAGSADSADSADSTDTAWVWPLEPQPRVMEQFDPPDEAYGAGHRGADLLGTEGDRVLAVAAGTVTYVGRIAGTGIVTVDHGGTESTYQPVAPSVSRGDVVGGGDPIGTLEATGSHCAPEACLHLGRVDAGEYADPLELLPSGSEIRLVTPLGAPPTAPVRTVGPVDGDGRLGMPVDGPVTSEYGMRLHPIHGTWKLHDGTDFGAPCGTPVRAAESGTVTATYGDAAYGNRVLVRHDASGVSTSYNHLTAWTVVPGERVRRGDVIGRVGSTGYSTGCHLHFMVEVDGVPADPGTWL